MVYILLGPPASNFLKIQFEANIQIDMPLITN